MGWKDQVGGQVMALELRATNTHGSRPAETDRWTDAEAALLDIDRHRREAG